jgi:hypothetical protein
MATMANGDRSGTARLGYVALHAVGAGAFFFVLQRFAFAQSVENSLMWAGFFAVAAALVAWRQTSGANNG